MRKPGKKFILKQTTNETLAIVKNILYEVDINTLHRIDNVTELKLNSIGRIQIKTAKPIFSDEYTKNRNTGSFILINPQTYETVGAGMIIKRN